MFELSSETGERVVFAHHKDVGRIRIAAREVHLFLARLGDRHGRHNGIILALIEAFDDPAPFMGNDFALGIHARA